MTALEAAFEQEVGHQVYVVLDFIGGVYLAEIQEINCFRLQLSQLLFFEGDRNVLDLYLLLVQCFIDLVLDCLAGHYVMGKLRDKVAYSLKERTCWFPPTVSFHPSPLLGRPAFPLGAEAFFFSELISSTTLA